MSFELVLVLFPFIVLVGGLFFGRSILVSASMALTVLLFLLLTYWQMSPLAVTAALFKTGLVTLDIALILFGAVVFMAFLKVSGAVTSIQAVVAWVSPDKRVQALLIGFFFVGVIEGLAGFGTPAMLAVPILITLGFPARAAILMALLGNVVFVPFGAVGTPLLIGVLQGLGGVVGYESAASLGMREIVVFIVLVGLPVLVLMPLLMSCVLTQYFGSGWKQGLQIWRHSLCAGMCVAIPMVSIAILLGPEFPSLLGALLGGGLFCGVLRLPRFRIVGEWRFSEGQVLGKEQVSQQHSFSWIRMVPFVLVIGLMIVSRVPVFGVREFLQQTLAIQFDQIAGLPVSHSVQILASPGVFLLFGAFLTTFSGRVARKKSQTLVAESLKKIIRPVLNLLVLILVSQLLLLSGINSASRESIPVFVASLASQLPIAWPLVAPSVGLFGAFLTGSATVSNLLFASFQAQTAVLEAQSVGLLVALQVLGAAAGNLIALHNIIAVLTMTGSRASEHEIFSMLIKPALVLVGVFGLLGFGASWVI